MAGRGRRRAVLARESSFQSASLPKVRSSAVRQEAQRERKRASARSIGSRFRRPVRQESQFPDGKALPCGFSDGRLSPLEKRGAVEGESLLRPTARETVKGPLSRPFQTVENPGPSRTTIVPGGLNGGAGRTFAAENTMIQSKNRILAGFAAGIRRIQAKPGEGGRGGGAGLSKNVLTS